jgi:hypothetical protein
LCPDTTGCACLGLFNSWRRALWHACCVHLTHRCQVSYACDHAAQQPGIDTRRPGAGLSDCHCRYTCRAHHPTRSIRIHVLSAHGSRECQIEQSAGLHTRPRAVAARDSPQTHAVSRRQSAPCAHQQSAARRPQASAQQDALCVHTCCPQTWDSAGVHGVARTAPQSEHLDDRAVPFAWHLAQGSLRLMVEHAWNVAHAGEQHTS